MTDLHNFKPLRTIFALELPFGVHFDEPRVEWRRLFAEFFGTLMLVVVAAGAPVVSAISGGGVSPTAQVVAPGLIVMALIYATGAVVVCISTRQSACASQCEATFPGFVCPDYILMQLLGTATAVVFLRAVFGNVGDLGATLPAAGIGDGQALALEVLLTLGLVSVILGTASGAKNIGTNAALAVGAYVAMAGMWAAPIAGASMNPARSFGPALIGGHWHSAWVYIVGSMVGGLLAVGVAWLLRGPPSPAGNQAARGDIEFISDADTRSSGQS